MPPIDFGDTIDGDLNRIRRLFDNPRGWGTAVRRILSDLQGVFGSVANRDVGTMAGDVPVIDNNATVAGALGAATTDAPGTTTTAETQSPAEVLQAFAAAFNLIGVGALDFRAVSVVRGRYSYGRRFYQASLSTRPSLLIISGSSINTNFMLTPTDRTILNSTPRVVINGNLGALNTYTGFGTSPTLVRPYAAIALNAGPAHGTPVEWYPGVFQVRAYQANLLPASTTQAVEYLAADTAAEFGFDWGLRIRHAGSPGGVNLDGRDNYAEARISPSGDLFIAYKPAAATVYFVAANRPTLFFPSVGNPSNGQNGYALELLL